MDEKVSGGAIIQHLAKIRQRFVSQGISVPPPLRRGGGNANLNSNSRNTRSGSSTPLKKTKSLVINKSENHGTGSDDGEFDVDRATDSEEDFGETRAKHVRYDTKGKRRQTRLKEANSDDKGQEGEVTSKMGDKRKRIRSFGGALKQRKVAKSRAQMRKDNIGLHRPHSSVGSDKMYENGSDDNRTQMTSEERRPEDSASQRYLAVGATFFDDQDHDVAFQPRGTDAEELKVASTVAVLRLGNSERALTLLQGLKDQEQAVDDAEVESLTFADKPSISGVDGGGENITEEASLSVPDMNHCSASSRGNLQVSREYGRPLRQAPLPREDSRFVAKNNGSSVGHSGNSFSSGRNGEYGAPPFHHPDRHASYQWGLDSVSDDLVSKNLDAPTGYSAHINQQLNIGNFAPSGLFPDEFMASHSHTNSFPLGQTWSNQPVCGQNGAQQQHAAFPSHLEGFGTGTHHPWFPIGESEHFKTSAAFDQRATASPIQTRVAPTNLFSNNTGTGLGLIGNSFPQAQEIMSGNHQRVQLSESTKDTSSASVVDANVSPWNSLPSNHTSIVQIPDFGEPEDVTWNDFLVDFEDSNDFFETHLMNTISAQGDGGSDSG